MTLSIQGQPARKHQHGELLWNRLHYMPVLVWDITNHSRKARLQAGAGLMHFPLQILWGKLIWSLELLWPIFSYKSFRKSAFGGWSWTDPFPFTNPLGEARLEAGAWLRHFPLQILWGRLVWRLQLVWGTFLYRPFEKSLFGGWSWFDQYFSFPRHSLLTVSAKSYDSGFQTQF